MFGLGRPKKLEFAHGAVAGKFFAEALGISPDHVTKIVITADPREVVLVEVTLAPSPQQVSALIRITSQMKNVLTKQDRESRALDIVRQVLDAKDPEKVVPQSSAPTPITSRRRKSDA